MHGAITVRKTLELAACSMLRWNEIVLSVA